MREHEAEPVWGLPERPPAGEAILWQGAPDWRALARRTFHLRLVAAYLGGLWLLFAGSTLAEGLTEEKALRLAATFGLALAAVGLVVAFSWLIGRTTAYTITSRRVVLRYGIALSKTINLPFGLIDAASLRAGPGDIALQMRPAQRIAYLVLWPHARPWRLARAQPMMLAVPDAARVAQVLGRALAASAAQAAQPMPAPAGAPLPTGRPVTA